MLAAFVGGCKKDTYVPVEGKCPVVIATNPGNSATAVALNQVITVTFNELMDPNSFNQASFNLQGAAKIPGTVVYDGTTPTMSFTPTTSLTPNTTYVGTVYATVKDKLGNILQTNYVWSFSTGTTLSPMVIATDPTNTATGVVLNKVVSANFSMPMDPLTINATNFIVKQGANSIAGAFSYNGTVAYFSPTSAFTANTVYSATLTTGVKNTSGTPLANDYAWSFTTGTLTAPVVISTDPINNATGVALNKTITASFSTAMDALTINAANFELKQGTNVIAGSVSYAGTTASFVPTASLNPNLIYTATIKTGAKNMAGTPLANDHVWNFSTFPPSGPQTVTLGTVARFGIIAGVGVSNNAGFSVINDLDVGISPGVRSSVTGFPPATIVNGAIYASDDTAPPGTAAMLVQAKNDLTAAYLFAEGATTPAPATVAGDLGGQTLAPGIYKSMSTLLIQNGDLTLDAQGDVNAVWIFQIASGFTTVGGAGGNVILTGGAQAKNIFWQTGSSATIGDFTSFKGNILALTSITMNSGATTVGRMLCRNGSVVMTNANTINKP